MKHLSIVLLSLFASTASAQIVDISAIINAAQEIPAPTGVSDSAAGFAHLQLDESSNELSWNIAWQDLTGAPVGMHIHGPAGVGATAGVQVDLGGLGGLTSPSMGTATIAEEIAASLLAGNSYINIHTAANGPGEIRGQVSPSNINLSATLDAAQEIPAPTGVASDAGGSALLAYDPESNLLGWNISWENLTGAPVGMHFHGPAGFGDTAGVQVNVGEISGLTSPSIGSTTISEEFEEQLLAGDWYINIHTAANGPGEIRGQIVPEPSAGFLVTLGGLGMLGMSRRRR